MTDPQGFLDNEKAHVREEHESRFAAIARDLLGTGAQREDLTLCQIMVMAPSLAIGIGRLGLHARCVPPRLSDLDPEDMVERMFQFALVGIKSLGQDILLRGVEGKEGTA